LILDHSDCIRIYIGLAADYKVYISCLYEFRMYGRFRVS
jgi:hypothetical protein